VPIDELGSTEGSFLMVNMVLDDCGRVGDYYKAEIGGRSLAEKP